MQDTSDWRARSRLVLDRTAYHLQQRGLFAVLGAARRAWLLSRGMLAKPPKDAARRAEQRYRELLEEDLRNVERGVYPRELLFQVPYRRYLRVLPEALRDVPVVARRARRGGHTEVPPEAADDRYPPYYRRTFHWQTDGWLSSHSARIYDFSVEVVFEGMGDVMRRMAIARISEVARGKPDLRLLDLACGTGNFLLQLHRAAPAAQLHGLDLSAHYIEHAREVLAGVPVSLTVDNAESTSLAGESFDVVTSVFLFHELPKDARRNVAREALRLLKPGGRFVICDSAQLSDSADIEYYLDNFAEVYHEPYYKGYVRDDLAAMLAEVGFQAESLGPRYVSKIVVGTKPARAEA